MPLLIEVGINIDEKNYRKCWPIQKEMIASPSSWKGEKFVSALTGMFSRREGFCCMEALDRLKNSLPGGKIFSIISKDF